MILLILIVLLGSVLFFLIMRRKAITKSDFPPDQAVAKVKSISLLRAVLVTLLVLLIGIWWLIGSFGVALSDNPSRADIYFYSLLPLLAILFFIVLIFRQLSPSLYEKIFQFGKEFVLKYWPYLFVLIILVICLPIVYNFVLNNPI
jgi:hypothetical protein